MRLAGRLKLGFYPLPAQEAERLRARLAYPKQFSALDPCVGDGVAFRRLLEGSEADAHGIEIDAFRAEQAARLGIKVLEASAFQVRCPAESVSLLYLNPPYDFEAGEQDNQRLEKLFLEHVWRWLKPHGVLILVVPRSQVAGCARLLAEQFFQLRVYRLTEPECVLYRQVAVMALRRPRAMRLSDAALLEAVEGLRALGASENIPTMAEMVYRVPPSPPTTLTNQAIPLDRVEDLIVHSAAYRQAARVLLHQPASFRGRPLTPLHGGHVSLLATAGMLNGVFGADAERHIAHWRSVKCIDHWEELGTDGAVIQHDRESFSHELNLAFSDGSTQTLTHESKREDP
jgi:hypothetical protein